MAGNVIEVTNDSFDQEIVKSNKPVLVDFWAAWCQPCRAIAPAVQELAGSYGEKVKFAKLDIDSNQKVAEQFEIRSIPTLLLFKEGRVIGQIVGAVPKAKIEDLIKRAL
ncbi:MAG TPA: thioredoxin [Polyangia bacterium]|nr:thioredoxin [Polyangia bacterium]